MQKKVKKLRLSRETVRNLTENELQTMAGGAITTTCPRPCSLGTCVTECTRCSECCQ